jgi:hypothetical protein
MEGIDKIDKSDELDIVKMQKEVKKEAHKEVQELFKKQLIEKAVEEEKKLILNSTAAYGTLSRR